MKLTQSRQSKGAQFFRDVSKGQLVLNNNIDNTDNVIQSLPYEKSYIGRILYKSSNSDKDNDQNPFNSFVRQLVKNQNKERKLTSYINLNDKNNKKLSKDDFKNQINTHLSFYGRNLKVDADSPTLKEILLQYYDGNNDAENELKKLANYISNLAKKKTEKLKKSIKNNKIPFEPDGEKLKLTSDKMKLLFDFLKKDGVELTSYEKFQKDYKFSDLANKIESIISNDKNSVDKKPFPTKKIYQTVSDYDYDFRKKNEDNDLYLFYAKEVKNYFKRLFIDKKLSKKQYEEIKSQNYKSEKYIFGQVKRYIINQLVQGLILYGKIMHYCYDTDAKQFNDEINSDTLTYIQVEEAFKKQIYLSLSWAITRLNYFFNYGSQNEENLDKDKKEGDILLAKTFRDKFYEKVFNNNEKDDDGISPKDELYAKISTCFAINSKDNNDDDIKKLLEDCCSSVANIRHNVFHFKKENIFEILEEIKLDSQISKELLNRDILNIQKCFKEQIRSTALTDYYSFELLEKVFKNEKLEFFLYSSQYPMMPSFKKIHKRGCNISKSPNQTKEIKWLIELDSEIDNEGKLAYKNLLQLIYYHSFLPAIKKDEKLVTEFINKTKQWNKTKSIASQKAKKAKNKKINYYEFKYSNMPRFEYGIPLKDYLEELQRQQSIRENDEDKKDKDNYYVEFVQDIFVFAFDSYLLKIISAYDCYEELIHPKLKTKEESKETLEKLFNESNPILKIKTNLNPDTKFITMYPFFRLLDQRELNILLHQFIRYCSSTQKRSNTNDETLNTLTQIEELITLVQFTIPLQTKDVHFKSAMEKYFSEFFENKDPQNYDDFYLQGSKKEEDKLVKHRSMSLVARSGAMALYTKMFSSIYQINKSDYEKYKDIYTIKNNSEVTKIEEMQNRLQQLHEKLVRIKLISDTQLNDIKKYQTLAKQIKEYENLRHKLTFESLYRIHQLHVEILGRFAAFANDWERDMFFMFTALENRGKINFKLKPIFNRGKVVGNLNNKLKDDARKLFFELCWSNEIYDKDKDDNSNGDYIYDRLLIRNYCAHLNHMTQFKKNNETQPSIIGYINKLRVLLAYDIKRQNAVTKAVKEILEKHYKVKLTLKRSDDNPDKFVIANLESDEITHLKNLKNPVIIEDNDKFMISLIRKLLIFKFESANVK